MQSSFESQGGPGFKDSEEDQVVAYSGKRKQKPSKTVAKKASPKNAFFNNSIIGDMSHVWSKYRRN